MLMHREEADLDEYGRPAFRVVPPVPPIRTAKEKPKWLCRLPRLIEIWLFGALWTFAAFMGGWIQNNLEHGRSWL